MMDNCIEHEIGLKMQFKEVIKMGQKKRKPKEV